MTFAEIAAIAKDAVDENGKTLFKNVAYDHFAEGKYPRPPFMLFSFPRSNNFGADGKVYKKIQRVQYELYSDKKRPDIEGAFESWLDSKDMFYDKDEVWLSEEQLYLITYQMEVFYDG